MATAADTEILGWARARSFVVATLDADFHAILAVRNATEPSVIRIRLQGQDGAATANLLLNVLERYSEELRLGCMITIKRHKTTCHLLSTAE